MSNEQSAFATSLNMLLTTAARQHMNIYNMAIMTFMYVHGDSEPLDIARETGISRAHIYRQLYYLKDKDAVDKKGSRKDPYRQEIVLYGLTETGKRTVREWERTYRVQLYKLVEWNDNLRAAGRLPK